MKVRNTILFTIILFFFSNSVLADYCQDALGEFYNNIGNINEKKLIAFDDLKSVSDSLENLKVVINGESCAPKALSEVTTLLENLRVKRLQTLDLYFHRKIYEEAGTNLRNEYDFLTGKSKNKFYAYFDLFKDVPKTPLKNEPIVINPPIDRGPVPIQEVKPQQILETMKYQSSKKENGTSCSDIINQNETVNLDNVRNQDGVGWCYAYAGADLLSFRLHKKISAVSLYNSNQPISSDIATDTSANGGIVEQAITKYARFKNGLCLEENLPSSDFNFCTYNRYIDFLRNLNSRAQNLTSTQSANGMTCLVQNINAAFPGLDFNAIKNVIQSNGTAGLIENIYDLKCQNLAFRGIQIKPQAKYFPSTPKENLIKSLDETLERGDISSITYQYDKVSTDRSGDHASLVVGRRMNTATGKCEYLVRNSWGKTCNQVENSEVTCHKNCVNGECRYSGNFWVASNRLQESLKGVAYLPAE